MVVWRRGRPSRHRHGGDRRGAGLLLAAGPLAVATALLTNVASGQLPASWRPYLWLAWPLLGVALLAGAAVPARATRPAGPAVISPERQRYARTAMLRQVRSLWIDRVLDRSIHRRTLLDLGLEHRRDLVDHPWDVLVGRDGDEPRSVDPDAGLLSILDADGALLILGAPGAGKSTMLLGLARDLLDRAQADAGEPIPVVFRLASWGRTGKPLAEWIVDELAGELYGVPRDLAGSWVAEDRVLPLLDGLDEVTAEHRAACAAAIDEFSGTRRLLPLVVSSRLADYAALDVRLGLPTAVVLQPLSTAQVEAYLARLGDSTRGLRQALAAEPALWDLLGTPLLLSIAVRAYQGVPVGRVLISGSPDERRTQLFDAFVDRALRRRAAGPSDPDTARRWLAYLARGLGGRLDDVLYLETISPAWLPAWARRVARPVPGIVTGTLVAAGVALVGDALLGAPVGTVAGVVFGLAGAIAVTVDGRSVLPESAAPGRFALLWDVLFRVRVFGVGLAVGLGVVGAVAGAAVGLLAGLFGPAGTGPAVLSGVAGGALLLGCGGLLLGAGTMAEGEDRTWGEADAPPSAGIAAVGWATAGTALVVGGPLAAVLTVLSGWPAGLGGALLGLAVADRAAGEILTSYAVRRLLLRVTGLGPLRYVRFLDHAAREALLIQVGGGYLFHHRLLLEYFASLDEPGLPRGRDGGLPPTDLRPAAMLAAAADLATSDPYEASRRLMYAAADLDIEVVAPVAFAVARGFEVRAAGEDLTRSGSGLLALRAANRAALSAGRAALAAESAYLLVARSGHPDLVPEAAFRLGELMRTFAEPVRHVPGSGDWDPDDMLVLYRFAAASGHPVVAPAAAQTLDLLERSGAGDA